MWTTNNIEHILHLPYAIVLFIFLHWCHPDSLHSVLVIYIREHTKLVLHVHRALSYQLEIIRAQSRAQVYSIDKHPA